MTSILGTILLLAAPIVGTIISHLVLTTRNATGEPSRGFTELAEHDWR